MSITRNIIIGFSLVILMLIALGFTSVHQIKIIGKNANDLYKHPFAVSNAAQTINTEMVAMHRYMKDVVLAQNEAEFVKAIEGVAQHEQVALSQFNVIFDQFLGEKDQINRVYKAFIDWKPIRDEVIRLVRQGKNLEAADITKEKGAKYVQYLNEEVEGLVAFAKGKAELFSQNAAQGTKQVSVLLIVLSVAAGVISIGIAFYVTNNLLRANKERMQRQHLVDQHIMIAHLDKGANILDVSNALCRFLGKQKEDLIGHQSGFFDNSDEMEETCETISRIIQTGKEWKGEIKRIGPDGDVHWASSSIVPIFDEKYELIGFNNILVDVTSKKLSLTDKLTHLYNRRRYEEILPREMRLAKRNDLPITLAIMDIDYFKKYNDLYGHPQGDNALSQVAEQFLSCLKRPNDYAFRIGGEEFAVILSGLSVSDSNDFLNGIREAVAGLHIMHEDSDVSDHLTISIGAYVMNADQRLSEEQFYSMADKALYMAKGKRNSVVVNSQNV
ncbi:diguanylate cyclase [Terasakiella sp. A23]|uniref:diguanylate cyclase n=1 Tax=Terasakiella sp. FCG-A23 TaxID=3080561 RepID=UPI002954E1B7|nr:diguanylate cyclase [Terasakiella sp. A23]MDV7341646.1 diguanylate cyclase [Terasakiella sp. A23]